MLHDVLQKLTSKRGASLSMALMLLLVCTTVAGVALTAATVVAGRQARTKDVDKSYYNVTSAAKLYWDKMQKDDTVVVNIKRTCTIGSDGQASWDCTVDGTSVVSSSINNTNASMFELASYDYLFDNTDENLAFNTPRKLSNGNEGIIWSSGSSAPPVLAEIDPEEVKDCAYKSFDITPSDSSITLKDHFKTVQVTVKRKLANTYEFVFKEKSDPDRPNAATYECTLTAAMVLGGGEFSPVKDDADKTTGYTTEITATWTPLSMDAGGSGQ